MNQTLRTKRLDMTLDDRLSAKDGWVYMTGMQALVRLPIQQHKRDQAAGLNTGGYISGYRGSPLGTFDLNLKRAESDLRAHNIHFQPGVNEDLAATATWGAQMVGLAEKVMCDCLFANMLLVGAAWQQGAIPLSLKAIHRAIALNGAAIEKNRQAFDLGRLAMSDPAALRAFALMNRFRFLRGTALDPFRNTGEAQLGRKLLADYQDDIDFALAYGDKANDTKIVELLDLPEAIRGYGHVREVHAAKATAKRNQLKSAITSETATAA